MNEKTVTEWWKPVRKVKSLGANNYFRSKHKRTAIRSYTLMGWASTREMGCSIAKCGEDWVEACRYYPPGNKVNTKMYETGTPCSGCNKLEPCDTGLGLCGSEE
ncbi:unnamed protein product [Cylicocyclus nassatus]|uniref:SCP domain-containing protein n=1 Tax=Cylicocyclus nassatus TaxID=53992 RepID=A0AA36HGX5_CYLNA|nr:unnamed protein product [Cylicocyclus nassatus]